MAQVLSKREERQHGDKGVDTNAAFKRNTKSQPSPSSAVTKDTSSGYSTAPPSALAEVSTTIIV